MMKLPGFEQLPFSIENGAVAVAIAVGTLYCFLGYRALKFITILTGFILAGSVAALFAGWVSNGQPIAAVICGVLGGACGACALLFLFRCGVFLVAALGAFIAGMHLTAQIEATWVPWAVLGASVIGGVLGLWLRRTIAILATAAIGSWMMVSGVLFFLAGPGAIDTPSRQVVAIKEGWVSVVCWGVLALAGILAQFATKPGANNQPPQQES